ncbi:MAG: hypothetical protein ABIP94_22080 [Planctomycetota bacterium]
MTTRRPDEVLVDLFAGMAEADLILFKLMADRPKDRVDVQNVLTVQGIPEPEYLRDWAARLGVADRLERALAEAGLGP